MLVKIGQANEPSVKSYIFNWLMDHNIQPRYARLGTNDSCLNPTSDVFTLDGCPFFIDLEFGDLVPYACNVYHLYRDVYLPVILKYGGQLVDELYYPMLAEETETDLMVRAKTYRSHMYGEKSKSVKWEVTFDRALVKRISLALQDTHALHVQDMQVRYDIDPRESEAVQAYWLLGSEYPMPGIGLTYAVEVKTGRYLAAMQLLRFGEGVDCNCIAVDKRPQYRTYSLTVAAQIFTGLWALRNGIKTVNFGMNPPGRADYKADFCRMLPIYGLTPANFGA